MTRHPRPPTTSLGRRPRDILRINAYATLACATLIAGFLVPTANRAGMSRLGLAGFVVALALAGGDELFGSVGRRIRRVHIVPIALMNAAASTACIALLTRSDGLSPAGDVVVASAAALFGTFAILETRAARSL